MFLEGDPLSNLLKTTICNTRAVYFHTFHTLCRCFIENFDHRTRDLAAMSTKGVVIFAHTNNFICRSLQTSRSIISYKARHKFATCEWRKKAQLTKFSHDFISSWFRSPCPILRSQAYIVNTNTNSYNRTGHAAVKHLFDQPSKNNKKGTEYHHQPPSVIHLFFFVLYVFLFLL